MTDYMKNLKIIIIKKNRARESFQNLCVEASKDTQSINKIKSRASEEMTSGKMFF